MSSSTPRPPRWMDDGDSPTCLACVAEFGVLLRRHHCRRCGGLFCHECSNNWVMVPAALLVAPPPFSLFAEVDPAVPNRCCAACVAFVNDFHTQRQQRAEQQRAAQRAETLALEQRIPSRTQVPVADSAGDTGPSSDPTAAPTAAPPDDIWAEVNAALMATGLLVVPCLEYRPAASAASDPSPARYKLHLVNVPLEIPPARKFQVGAPDPRCPPLRRLTPLGRCPAGAAGPAAADRGAAAAGAAGRPRAHPGRTAGPSPAQAPTAYNAPPTHANPLASPCLPPGPGAARGAEARGRGAGGAPDQARRLRGVPALLVRQLGGAGGLPDVPRAPGRRRPRRPASATGASGSRLRRAPHCITSYHLPPTPPTPCPRARCPPASLSLPPPPPAPSRPARWS